MPGWCLTMQVHGLAAFLGFDKIGFPATPASRLCIPAMSSLRDKRKQDRPFGYRCRASSD
jgi:hypothetical protein